MTGKVYRAAVCAVSVALVTMQWGCFLEPDPPEPTCVGSYCDTYSPAKLNQIEWAKRAVLGTWLLESQLTGRDDVDRPLPLGRVSWDFEIREITPLSPDVQDTRYEWWGVLRAHDLCLVNLESFQRDGGECTVLEPVDLGSCSGRECNRYVERRVEGDYDVETDQFEIDMVRGDVFYVDHLAGYINVDIDIAMELRLDDSEAVLECDTWCSFSLDPQGLFADQYPDLYSDEWSTTLTWIGDERRDPTAPVDDVERSFEIGEIETVEQTLLGDWNVRLTFETTDNTDQPVTVGYADYLLDVFEVESANRIGEWTFQGGLLGKRFCLISIAEAEAGTLQCDIFEPAIHGICSTDTCEDRGEIAIDGDYNHLTDEIRFDWTSGDLYFQDDRGLIFLDTTLYLRSAQLVDQRVAPTPTDGWSDWWFHVDGALVQTYYEYLYGGEKSFEMWR